MRKDLDYRGFVIKYNKDHAGDFPWKVNNASYMNPKQARDSINQHLAEKKYRERIASA